MYSVSAGYLFLKIKWKMCGKHFSISYHKQQSVIH